MISGIRNVLFDLDGTLVDSSGTVGAALEYALERVGAGGAGPVPVRSFIGKPLLDILREDFGLDEGLATEAIDHYRGHYDRLGMEGTEIYPGVPETLSTLKASGYRLYLATVKPTPIAERVLQLSGLRSSFDGVAGASMGPERRDKSRVIAHALDRFGLKPNVSLMVGDRRQDIAGARENGLAAIGVAYGFGSREELGAENPARIVERSSEIVSLLSAD
ncbi:MAG: HAD-IA family hydrolase [Gammaproteobacteria bacterium]|nr:HAD-IA family hydrolase [Gammaproteobacteria bacterium]